MNDGTPPILCPRCRKTLYPIAHLRPRASLCLAARVIFLAAALLATSIFWLVALWVWYRYEIQGPTVEVAMILSAVALPPALIPGLGITWLAYRLPRILKLQCSSCGWYETYRLSRLPPSLKVSPARVAPASTPEPVRNGPRTAGDSPFDLMVDDGRPRDEAVAWAYAEVAAGRVVEEVAADLIASGWSQEVAEAMVEDVRLQTRHLRSPGRR